MTRDELKLIISIKQRKFINAIIKIGLKKSIKASISLHYPNGLNELGIFVAEVFNIKDLTNRKSPEPLFHIKSDNLSEIDREFLSWLIKYKSKIDKVLIK